MTTRLENLKEASQDLVRVSLEATNILPSPFELATFGYFRETNFFPNSGLRIVTSFASSLAIPNAARCSSIWFAIGCGGTTSIIQTRWTSSWWRLKSATVGEQIVFGPKAERSSGLRRCYVYCSPDYLRGSPITYINLCLFRRFRRDQYILEIGVCGIIGIGDKRYRI